MTLEVHIAVMEEYVSALREYVAGGGESSLQRAYEIGRGAVGGNLTMLRLAEIHNEAVTGILSESTSIEQISLASARAAEFFIESLSPFEMTQRGYDEANRLRRELAERNRELAGALTELQQAQQHIIQQERLRSLGQMTSGIAHDFNNALVPIIGFSELLIGNPGKLEDREGVKRYLEMINTAAQDAAAIVNRLREFYRKRDEGETFGPLRLNALVVQAVSLTQARWKDQAQANGIQIGIETDLQDIPQMSGSESEIREVLTNLILNAVDAMPQGGTITLRTRREGNYVALEVSDTGTGMTEDVRQHCLDPFFTTKGSQGTGMGLAMVHGIVRRHEGNLQIQSEAGRGTTFIIVLPLRTPGLHRQGGPPMSLKAPRPMRILVVDDERMVRFLMAESLTDDGHSVKVATNGREGLEMFGSGGFDLVITDRAMPEMNGDQLAVAIKQIQPQVTIIMLTGFGDMMKASDEIPPAVDLILGKPVRINELRYALTMVTSYI